MIRTCIACPRGCRLEITGDPHEPVITGNFCPKGLEYGRQEAREPMRMLTTTVRTSDPDFPRLPVRLSREIPLADFRRCLERIAGIVIVTGCRPGDVLVPDLAGEGVDLVATGDLSFGR